jgi:hypothetical protein
MTGHRFSWFGFLEIYFSITNSNRFSTIQIFLNFRLRMIRIAQGLLEKHKKKTIGGHTETFDGFLLPD